ncbi:MAG: flagellar export protein FliJ [Opitutales bacterium]|nr:flagellar export protein FliJ [Opitutales bacterium]
MKRFDFRLESVRILRQRVLNDAESSYGRAVRDRRRAETAVAEGDIRLKELNAKMTPVPGGRFSPSTQSAYVEALREHDRKVQGLRTALTRSLQYEAKCRKAFIAAKRDHEALVNLKERQRHQHFYRQDQFEQREMDDMFNARRQIEMTAATLEAAKATWEENEAS